MPVFSGSVSGSILQVAKNVPSEIISFSLVNETAGALTATVYIRDEDGNDTAISKVSVPANGEYVSDAKRKVLGSTSIYLITSGAISYYFSIG